MKLTVLGGSAAGGGTGAGSSGYLVQLGSTSLVLDAGPAMLPELRKHTDFRTLDAVFISHIHVDHILDLAALRFALAYNPRRPAAKIPLWLPPGGLAWLDRFAAGLTLDDPTDFFTDCFIPKEYDPSGAVEVGELRVTFAPTVHWVPCWAFRVSPLQEISDLGYTADTGPHPPLERFFKGVEVLVAEGTDPEPHPENTQAGHLSPSEAAELASACGARTLVLTHLWEEFGLEKLLADAQRHFEGNVVLARPGTTVEW